MKLNKTEKRALYVFILVIVIFLIYAFTLIALTWPISEISIDKSAVFGDSFGALTSIFSGLAFAGVIWTIMSQREELKITRDELKTQGFENAFFQMLKLHNEILNEITINQSNAIRPDSTSGRDCFVEFYDSLKIHYKAYKSIEGYGADDNLCLKDAYIEYWGKNGDKLAHYFRFLFNIFKFIDESNIDNKKFYSRLVRAQLSDQELAVIYYNTFSPYGIKFLKYIEEFQLMDNLKTSYLIDESHSNIHDVDIKFCELGKE